MRSLTALLVLCAACGGARTPEPARAEFDPELAEACVPEWGSPPPALCVQSEESGWIMPDDDPDRGPIAQALLLQKEHGGRQVDEAVVQMMTHVIDRAGPMTCGKQAARWQRATALARLGRWTASFTDFGAAVQDGPNAPNYGLIGDWLTLLEPHLPKGAVEVCRMSYSPTLAPTTPDDPHRVPYAPDEPAP